MGSWPAASEHVPMSQIATTQTGRALHDPSAVSREARRLVGFERHYHCAACGHDRRTWTRAEACPDCGEHYVSAVIHRAAVAS